MTDTPPNILIVEDEHALADVLRDYLLAADMTAELMHDGTGAADRAVSGGFDLLVLDLMLPGVDGLTICKAIRAQSDLPIIMTTARVEEIDRLLGLELGADDYLCKPYSPRELVARIKAVPPTGGDEPRQGQERPPGVVQGQMAGQLGRATAGSDAAGIFAAANAGHPTGAGLFARTPAGPRLSR